MNNEMIVCVPTYKRKWPVILSCIRSNKNITFYLFVRKSDYDNHYYDDEQFKLKNIVFVPIENVNCIGETREAILQYAISNKYKYCFMIDDTQYGLQDITDTYKSLYSILNACISRFEEDSKKDTSFAFVFHRKVKYVNRCLKTYFLSQLCQTYILNCDVCKKYNLHFKAMKDVGIEDLDFYIEAADKNLVALSDTRFIRVGEPASISREGGCHYNMEAATNCETQLIRAKKLINYITSNNCITDKNFLKIQQSILYPGTFYCKFDSEYARKKLIK